MQRIKFLSLGAAGLLAAGLIAACGGASSGGDEDPQQVLEETFSGEKDVNSGVIELVLEASGQNDGEDASIAASFTGPFQNQGEARLPAFDFSFDLSLESPDQDASFDGAATSTGDRGFLTFMGTTYDVGGEIFDRFKEGFERGRADSGAEGDDAPDQLEALGIDPTNWLTNLQNEGTEDVEGAETIHISGDANVPQIVEDIQALVEQAGEQITPVPTDQLGQIEDAITAARFDVFTGVDDRILRRLTLTFAIEIPEELDSSGGEANVDLSVTLSELNEEQTIEAPADAQPLSELLSQLGLLGLGGGDLGLGDLGLDIGPGAGDEGAPAPPEDQGSEAPEVPEVPEVDPGAALPEGAEEYLDCVASAESPADLQDCAEQFAQ